MTDAIGGGARQLALDLQWDDTRQLHDFEPGANAIALGALEQVLDAGGALYLWGSAASGKTHLLRGASLAAQQRGRRALYLTPDSPPSHWPTLEDIAEAGAGALLAVDDVHRCSAWQQDLLFGLFNAARQSGAAFVAAGDAAPAQLNLRDDLRTRLAWGLALQLQPLDDAAKQRVLQRIAAQHGLQLRDDLSRYILNHQARDMQALVRLLARLDAYALQQARAPSIPLLKAMLADLDAHSDP